MTHLVFYSHHAKKTEGTVRDKINEFLTKEPDREIIEKIPGISERMGCIAYSKETKHFYCLPLKGYNTRTYEIEKHPAYKFECNCQGWQASKDIWEEFQREMESVAPLLHPHQFEHLKARIMQLSRSIRQPSCSHTGALFEYFAQKNNILREHKVSQAMLTIFMEE